MKKILLLLICLILAANLPGCSKTGEITNIKNSLNKDFSGNYAAGNDENALITITKKDNANYNFLIEIHRLCVMEGIATNVDDFIEILLTDPGEGKMTAIFFKEKDETYTFRIINSSWEYLKEGSDITGFKKKQNPQSE